MAKRGALIILEGCDRVGKSTQAKLIVEKLNARGSAAKLMNFPDRSTTIGKLLDQYLKCGEELDDHAVHLLFSANRWEAVKTMESLLVSGTSLIIDRYAYSGVAFTAAKGLPLQWCKSPDAGLPRPDLVLYLTLGATDIQARQGFGEERYEKEDFQAKVSEKFRKLSEENWKLICADKKDIETMNAELLSHVTSTIKGCQGEPIGRLWGELEGQGPSQ